MPAPTRFAASPLTGVDIASVERIAAALERNPRLRDRVFTPAEQAECGDRPDRWAGRWAAKEAVRKLAGAAGGPAGGAGVRLVAGWGRRPLPAFRDGEVLRAESGAPVVRHRGEDAGV